MRWDTAAVITLRVEMATLVAGADGPYAATGPAGTETSSVLVMAA